MDPDTCPDDPAVAVFDLVSAPVFVPTLLKIVGKKGTCENLPVPIQSGNMVETISVGSVVPLEHSIWPPVNCLCLEKLLNLIAGVGESGTGTSNR